MQIRVPVDDTHTMQFWYHAYVPPEGADVPEHLLTQTPPLYHPKIWKEDGAYNMEFVDAQDIMAWVTQGPIADRTQEHLGASDQGVMMYRKMLRREMERVEAGEDPLGIIRDPAKNHIEFELEKGKVAYQDGFAHHLRTNMISYSPVADDLIRIFTQPPGALSVVDKREPLATK
jgi:5,5'-dehydrodivanillate O-demethylase